jgi:hypothetical protein
MDSDPLENSSYLHFSEEFDPSIAFPLFDPPFIEEMHSLSGTTHADNMRHIIARIELLNCFSEDPRVIARIETWGNDTGLIQAAEEFVTVLDSIAQLCGLAHRSDLFLQDQNTGGIRLPDDMSDEKLSSQLSQAIARYQEAMHCSSQSTEAAITYVRDELHLPWPWLALELHLKLLMDTYQYIIGIDALMGYRLDPDDPPAASFSWTFETRPGETVSAAQRRFTEEANTAFAQLHALADDGDRAPLGRIHKHLEDTVRRNTRWFYRYRICGEPQRQIARTYHAERAGEAEHNLTFERCSCRTNVRDGIKEAKRVLGLTPFRF